MTQAMKTRVRRHKTAVVAALLTIVVAVCSCSHNEAYFEYREIRNAQWQQTDTLTFGIDSAAIVPGMRYDISIETTNNVNYAYQNIWLFVQDDIDAPADSVYNSVQKEFVLADQYGRWLGSGFGSLFQSSLIYKKNIVFAQKRNYLIRIEHGMRDETLSGIEKVGVRISKSQ